ncbi:MAG TPA: class I SAM-dependent methyltransferase [Pseudomonadales bacterium]
MTQDKYTMFRNRLQKVFAHRRKVAKKQGVSCYRLYDLDLPEFPLAIDLYEDRVHVSEYRRNHTLSEAEHAGWLDESTTVIADVLQLPREHIHVKERAVIADRKEQYGHFASTGARHVVHENGLKFYVNLSDYLDTGLFLDHRPMRAFVREISRGKDVLNLFAYTGSFSVYAAHGGARSVHTVDLSNTYLDWARDNFTLNGLDTRAPAWRFTAADVMALLPTLPSASYDLIVCDPPTFSNSKRMRGVFDVQRDHPALINQCLRLLRPTRPRPGEPASAERLGPGELASQESRLLFSTNQRRFRLYDEHIETDRIRDLTKQSTGFDFDGKLNRLCYEFRSCETAHISVSPWRR